MVPPVISGYCTDASSTSSEIIIRSEPIVEITACIDAKANALFGATSNLRFVFATIIAITAKHITSYHAFVISTNAPLWECTGSRILIVDSTPLIPLQTKTPI